MQHDEQQTRNEPGSLYLRNPVTKLMKKEGYGKGYKYAHDYSGHFVPQQNLPDALKNKRYYIPSDQGQEKEIDKRLKGWRKGEKASGTDE